MCFRFTAYIEHLRQIVESPRRIVVATAVLVCALPFLFGIAFVTPSYFAKSFHKLVAKSPHDGRVFGYAYASALSLSKPEEAKIVLIGASSMRAAFDKNIMQDEVFNLTGIRTPVYNLAVESQTIIELLSMVEHIPDDSTGTLFVKVSPISMTKDYLSADMELALQTKDRFTLQTPLLAAEMKTLGIRDTWSSGNFFLDNIVYFCSRYKNIAINMLTNKRYDAEHVYINKGQVSQKRWNIRGVGVLQSLSAYQKNKELNFNYLQRLVAYVRQKTKMNIILVEQLYNPRLSQEYISPSFYAGYQRDITSLADSLNISYLDLPAKLKLDAADFYDWTHINSASAIDKASRQLAQAAYSGPTNEEPQ